MAGPVGHGDSLGEVLDELTLGTDHEISVASDNYQSLVGSALRGLDGQIAQSRAEQQVMLSGAIGTVDDHLQESQAIQRALLSKAARTLDSNILAAQGSGRLFGLVEPPAVFPSAPPAVAPSQASDATAGGGGGSLKPFCNIHQLPEDVRPFYLTLCKYLGSLIAVCPQPMGFVAGPIEYIHRFPNWWSAELACRLINDCHYTLEQIRPHFTEIAAVVLFANQPGAQMGPMCQNAQSLFNLGLPGPSQTAPPPPPGEIEPPCSLVPPQDIGVIPCKPGL